MGRPVFCRRDIRFYAPNYHPCARHRGRPAGGGIEGHPDAARRQSSRRGRDNDQCGWPLRQTAARWRGLCPWRLRDHVSRRRLFPPFRRDAPRSAVPRSRADPLRRQRGRSLSRPAAGLAVCLFDLPGQLAMRTEVQFLRRGKTVKLAMSPTLTLLDYLRLTERATGTKEGCAEGDCGACTVVLRRLRGERLVYAPVNACIVLAGQADGADLISVEEH